MVNVKIILLLIGVIAFIKFGGAKASADLIQMAKADLTIFKETLKSDNVMDIDAKTEAGKLGQEG